MENSSRHSNFVSVSARSNFEVILLVAKIKLNDNDIVVRTDNDMLNNK